MFKIISFMVLALYSKTVLAQRDTLINESSLDPVIITAKRSKENMYNSPGAVSFIMKKEIRETNSRSVPEMLMGLTGVWMQKTAHAGGSPFIRGLTGNQVLQMVDGIRLNNSTFRYGPNQYLSTIDPYSVEQAEVVRSAYSTLYGSDAVGGVINILTSDPAFSEKPGFHGSFTGKWMSRDMEKTASARLGYKSKHITGEVITTLSDFGNIYAAEGREQVPGSYKQQSFHSRWKYAPSEKHVLGFCFQQLSQNDVDLYDQVAQRGYSISKIDPQKRQLVYLRWEYTMKKQWSDKLTITASRQVSTEERIRQKNLSELVSNEFDHVVTNSVQVETEKRIKEGWRLFTGMDLYMDDVKSSAYDMNSTNGLVIPKRGLYADGSSMNSLSFYHQQQWEKGKWLLVGGLRANFYAINIPDPKFGVIKLSPFAIAGNASMQYTLSERWNVAGTLSSSYRAPNINDLSSFGKFDFGTEVPPPSLSPEKSLNKEISIRHQGDNAFISITGFHNRLCDLIDRVRSTYEGDSLINGDQVYQKTNRGEGIIYGAEAEGAVWFNKKIKAGVNFTYTYGQNITFNEPLRRIPPVFGKISAAYYPRKEFLLGADWNFAGSQNRLSGGDKSDHRINPEGTPGWGIISFRLGRQFRFFSVNGGVENILDQAYRIHGSGIDGYGRYFWVKITFSHS
jgi:outer membrane receptor for ferrienterochelin and colicin